MTRTFCTLFDKNYLYQGVALHASLVRHSPQFRLYALCMDETAYALLARMALPTLVPIAVDRLITPTVADVRARTTHGQFCWVSQPLICRYLLDEMNVDMVTYLESDSLFFSSPEPLFAELGARSASVVPHNFTVHDNSATAGLYCVQFNAFRNDAAGREVLDYWTQACFRYDRSAPLVYPGQTCLDDWPTRFKGVAVIEHRGAGVAPWNVGGYRLGGTQHEPQVEGVPVVFYHYHQYGRYDDGAHELGSYPLTPQIIERFYRPYVEALREAERSVHAVDPAFRFRREYRRSPSNLGAYVEIMKRKLRRRYNVYPDTYFADDAGGSGR